MMTSFAVLLLATAVQQASCEALKSLSLPNTTITTAEFVAAGPQRGGRGGQAGSLLPAHCRIAAVLKPSADSEIGMELWMPAEGWNGKFLAVGNGGWAGNIETGAIAGGLSRGYAAASNDTGHKSNVTPGASFALGHPEKVIDFGYRAMHEMAVRSKAMIQAFYNRAPQLSYYQGCSTGGRQGLMEAQRYPEDFDAIIAGAPVNNQIHLNTSQVELQVQMLREPAMLVPPAKITMLANAVLNACDANDGVKDNIVNDPEMCKFDPAVLQCKAGDAADCMTSQQMESLKRSYDPVRTSSGAIVYPGRAFGYESGWRIPAPGSPLNPLYADMPRYIANQDANWDLMSFNLDADLERALKNAGFIESTDPNLEKFKARGGKLILYHGWADPGPSPLNTIDYFSAVNETLGGNQSDWMRMFLMPGVAHCGGGAGPDQADFLGAMERWRESGIAPGQIIASRGARGEQPAISRPLCPYPQVAQYKGSGDTNDASSFACTAR